VIISRVSGVLMIVIIAAGLLAKQLI